MPYKNDSGKVHVKVASGIDIGKDKDKDKGNGKGKGKGKDKGGVFLG
jgi:hypothetical protein